MFGALDKTNGYDFVYRQHVVRPALIGMLGAWISGGIEWNFPHHHRATAFMPVDCSLHENPDGSATLWIGELEIRHRMKFMLGITVHPGRSYFEVSFRPFNRTPFPHSFLYLDVEARDQPAVAHGERTPVLEPSEEVKEGTPDSTRYVDRRWAARPV